MAMNNNPAIQKINLGSSPKGEGGDNSREAGKKINANFEDLDERVALAKSVADSKTTNATDAHLLNRSNHTGTQSISTISGLQAALDSAASQVDITGNAATATKLANARTISLTGGVTGSVSFDGSANAAITTTVTGLGVANGIATLDSSGQVPSTQLPSYVDDVLEYLNVAAFPTTGETGKIYVETTGNTTYRWSGSAYVKITSGEVASVAGKVGVVTLTKSDVGLSNVDNTADSAKNVASATKLTTARTINGVAFDGTQNISLPVPEAYSLPTASASVLGGVKVGTGLSISNSILSVGTLNQDTTGNAATATSALHANEATHAVSSDTADSANHAATAGKLGTPVQINGVDFDGSQSINIVIPGGGEGGSTSYADTAGRLANPVQIHGVNFDGSIGINIPNFTATKSGVVPAAGSDTTKYLRSDGTWQVPMNTTYTVFGASPGLVPAKVGSTTTKFLREDGAWVIPTDTQYSAMTSETAEAGTATTSQLISPSVLKQAIQTHAPTGGGTNFAAKVEIELEIVVDIVSGGLYTSRNILSVSNQANIASAVLDNNGILCLTFNTPISNPNLIVTTKGEVKNFTIDGVDYMYLTSPDSTTGSGTASAESSYSIIQDAEKGYVNTSTKLYISCNLNLVQDRDANTGEILGTYTLYSAFPAKFNLGIIDA